MRKTTCSFNCLKTVHSFNCSFSCTHVAALNLLDKNKNLWSKQVSEPDKYEKWEKKLTRLQSNQSRSCFKAMAINKNLLIKLKIWSNCFCLSISLSFFQENGYGCLINKLSCFLVESFGCWMSCKDPFQLPLSVLLLMLVVVVEKMWKAQISSWDLSEINANLGA